MYSNSKDQKALEESYLKVHNEEDSSELKVINEEEDPSEYNSIHYDESVENYKGNREDWEVEHEGKTFYVNFEYDFDESYTPSTQVQPAEYSYVGTPEFTVTSIYYDPKDGGDWINIDPEQQSDLYKEIADKAESDFMSDSGNYAN